MNKNTIINPGVFQIIQKRPWGTFWNNNAFFQKIVQKEFSIVDKIQ